MQIINRQQGHCDGATWGSNAYVRLQLAVKVQNIMQQACSLAHDKICARRHDCWMTLCRRWHIYIQGTQVPELHTSRTSMSHRCKLVHTSISCLLTPNHDNYQDDYMVSYKRWLGLMEISSLCLKTHYGSASLMKFETN